MSKRMLWPLTRFAMIAERIQRCRRHRVDGIRANQLFDIQRVAVRRVLGAGAGPQQTLWPRARLLRELLPARRREDVAVVLVGPPRIGDRNRPASGRAHV